MAETWAIVQPIQITSNKWYDWIVFFTKSKVFWKWHNHIHLLTSAQACCRPRGFENWRHFHARGSLHAFDRIPSSNVIIITVCSSTLSMHPFFCCVWKHWIILCRTALLLKWQLNERIYMPVECVEPSILSSHNTREYKAVSERNDLISSFNACIGEKYAWDRGIHQLLHCFASLKMASN